jgi:hypothetical protein
MIVAKIVLPNFDTLLPSWNTKQQAANASVSTLEHMILILYKNYPFKQWICIYFKMYTKILVQ